MAGKPRQRGGISIPDPGNAFGGGKEPAGRSAESGEVSPAWPTWARVVASLVILYHVTAVVAGSLGVPPSSDLERGIADLFTSYHELMDQGYAYRYYAEPPPTPVVTATLEFGDGHPEQTVRLPGREVPGPRLRHQRQLALANALFGDYQEAKQASGEGERSRWARAYARHLCRTNPGCRSVTLRVQQHMNPDILRTREAYAARGARTVDLFDESLFTTPERIGDFPCDGF